MTALPAIPDFRLPPLLARVCGKLPQWPHGLLLSLLLNGARHLRLLPSDQLDELEGKRFRITVEDLDSVADFEYAAGRFRPLPHAAGTPHLAFSATAAAYLKMLSRQEDPDTLFFNRRLSIEGDTELGLRVKNMLDAMEPSRWRSLVQ